MHACVLLLLACCVAAVDILPIEPLPPPKVTLPPGEQPIVLERLEVSAEVRGLFAEVTTLMVLGNPNPRQLSGELEFPVPDGAAVCGYALDVAGRMVDGVIVSQERARVVLETESRRRVDPGLVEHVRGNLFRTRIFPLPPQGRRTVSVTWTAPLALRGDEAALRLPLPRVPLPELVLKLDISAGAVQPELSGFGDLKLTAWRQGHRAEARLANVQPGDDLLVRLPRLPERLVHLETLGGEAFALISVPLPLARPGAAPRRLAVAWDASGSVSEAAAARAAEALAALLRATPGLTLDVVPYHIAREPAQSFADADALTRFLAALPRDGATNLSGLDLTRAGLPHPAGEGWILVGDGLGTWGEGLPGCGDVPVNCLVAEAVRDDAVLRLIAARSGGQVIDLATTDAATAAERLRGGGIPAPRLDAPAGLLDGVQITQRGGRALVVARLRGAGRVALAWPGVSPVAADLDPAAAVPGRTLARGWAGLRAAELGVFPEANRSELLALGRTYGVVTAGTSLLVLESLDQYLRHGVEPPASWPELREQWATTMKQRGDALAVRQNGQHERLLAWWAERVRWWEGKEARPVAVKAQEANRPAPATTPVAALDLPAAASAPQPLGREEAVADSEMGGQGMFGSRSGGGRVRTVGSGGGSAQGGDDKAKAGEALAAAIQIAGWNPDTPWLRDLRAAPAGQAYGTWLRQRAALAATPSAILDCAGFVLAQDRAAGLRLLSNLAELRLDNPGLLRVLAWRLTDAGEHDGAVAVLRRVLRLRPEEPQSYRDLALALAARFDATRALPDATEALALLARVAERRPLEDLDLGERWTIDANWDRFPRIEVIALEELNRLAARAAGATVPELDARLRVNLDCDLRVVMSWDADATDIDLHVRQPNGEVAFYGRNRTSTGGLVSPDCTQGYGPEEYLIRQATGGGYEMFVRYFGSRQTGLLGPATVTATVYTDWGRPTERCQRLTLRLDRQGEQIPVGRIAVGQGAPATGPAAARTIDRAQLAKLRRGMPRAEAEALLGAPERSEGGGITTLVWRLPGDAVLRLGFGPELLWAREETAGAERELLRP